LHKFFYLKKQIYISFFLIHSPRSRHSRLGSSFRLIRLHYVPLVTSPSTPSTLWISPPRLVLFPPPIRSAASTSQLQSSASARLRCQDAVCPRHRSPSAHNLTKFPCLSQLPPPPTNRHPPLRPIARIPTSPLRPLPHPSPRRPASLVYLVASSDGIRPATTTFGSPTQKNDHLQLEHSIQASCPARFII
jgi:hypothetical protein